MNFLVELLKILDTQMTCPTLYGWFHILWLFLTAAATVALCRFFPRPNARQVRKLLLTVSLTVIALEVYKQVNYTFQVTAEGAIVTDFQWYAFPFQFCSMPMYVGLAAALIKKEKLHSALCAFLATYAVFAGAAVMLYPSSVFIGTVGINIQTMVCHGSMVVVGVYLLYTGYVPNRHGTVLKAMPVFATGVLLAVVMNELAHQTGLLETDTFNMFFVSPYCEPSLPVYSLIQPLVPFPWSLVIYFAGFSLAGYGILLLSMLAPLVQRKHQPVPRI